MQKIVKLAADSGPGTQIPQETGCRPDQAERTSPHELQYRLPRLLDVPHFPHFGGSRDLPHDAQNFAPSGTGAWQ